MKFWEQFSYAVLKPKKYEELVKLDFKSFITYYILLCVIISVMTFILPTAGTVAGIGGFRDFFSNKLPAFEIVNGELQCESGFEMNINDVNYVLDPTTDEVNPDDLKSDGSYFTFGKKTFNLTMVVSGKAQKFMYGDIKEFLPEGFNNKMLVSTIPAIYIAFGINEVIAIFGVFMKYAFLALVYLIMAMAYNKISGNIYKPFELYKICIYCQTLGMCLVNINAAFGYKIYPTILSTIGIFVSLQYISSVFRTYTGHKGED